MPAGIVIALIGFVEKAIEYIGNIRKNNAMTSGWTDAERAQVDTRWAAVKGSPAWQTDAEKAAGGGQ
jgi:hypothetical protein